MLITNDLEKFKILDGWAILENSVKKYFKLTAILG